MRCPRLIAPLLALPLAVLGVATAGACASSKEATTPSDDVKPATVAIGGPAMEADYAGWCQARLDAATKRLRVLESMAGPRTVESVLQPMNELEIVIDEARNKSELMASVHPDEGVRKAAEKCGQDFAKLITEVGLSQPLFTAVGGVDVSASDATTQRRASHLIRDFRRAGVDKDDATRTKIKALNEEIVALGQDFGRNIREDRRTIDVDAKSLNGLPQDYIDAHAAKDGKVTLSTDYPDYIPFMTYAKDDVARLEFYKLFRKRGHPVNLDVLGSLLRKRYELAQLLGYKSWAAFITEDKMIGTDTAAQTFIDKVNVTAKARADRDYAELLTRLKQDLPKATEVGDWQKTYVEDLVKKEKYAFDSQVVREYFSYAKAREGLFNLTSKMFGVSYEKNDAKVWHRDVESYKLLKDGNVIGEFFLDMHPRKNKYKHAAMFPVVTGVTGRQIPQASLVCNFPKDGPMEFSQVQTFFHEFGHLIHHLFAGEHDWVGLSGIQTEWDFVEAPSQIFEEWALDESVLKTFATNAKGEGIPTELIAALRKADGFGRGIWVRHQMFYASVSLNYYNQDPSSLDTTEVMKGLQATYSPFAYVDDTYFQTSFGHLDGYSAIYYTYMWSLVIAKDLYSRFQTEGLTNPKVADRYRTMVLAPGGTKDAAVLVSDFLERDYAFDAFAAWMNE